MSAVRLKSHKPSVRGSISGEENGENTTQSELTKLTQGCTAVIPFKLFSRRRDLLSLSLKVLEAIRAAGSFANRRKEHNLKCRISQDGRSKSPGVGFLHGFLAALMRN